MSTSTDLRRIRTMFWSISAVVAISVAIVTYFFPPVAVTLAIIFTSEAAGRRVLARATVRERKTIDGKRT